MHDDEPLNRVLRCRLAAGPPGQGAPGWRQPCPSAVRRGALRPIRLCRHDIGSPAGHAATAAAAVPRWCGQ
jgi:hypothetical protein